MLEEHGVRVHMPDEGVVLSMEASGALDGIKAAVARNSATSSRIPARS
jgi:hypothetical protein